MGIKRYENEEKVLKYLKKISSKPAPHKVSRAITVLNHKKWTRVQIWVICNTDCQRLYDLAVLHTKEYYESTQKEGAG